MELDWRERLGADTIFALLFQKTTKKKAGQKHIIQNAWSLELQPHPF
jgi:hypothetical protein